MNLTTWIPYLYKESSILILADGIHNELRSSILTNTDTPHICSDQNKQLTLAKLRSITFPFLLSIKVASYSSTVPINNNKLEQNAKD